jgi:hypothetical protein
MCVLLQLHFELTGDQPTIQRVATPEFFLRSVQPIATTQHLEVHETDAPAHQQAHRYQSVPRHAFSGKHQYAHQCATSVVSNCLQTTLT